MSWFHRAAQFSPVQFVTHQNHWQKQCMAPIQPFHSIAFGTGFEGRILTVFGKTWLKKILTHVKIEVSSLNSSHLTTMKPKYAFERCHLVLLMSLGAKDCTVLIRQWSRSIKFLPVLLIQLDQEQGSAVHHLQRFWMASNVKWTLEHISVWSGPVSTLHFSWRPVFIKRDYVASSTAPSGICWDEILCLVLQAGNLQTFHVQ